MGEISNDEIENCFLETPVSENETPSQLISENDNKESLATTPMSSPSYMTFGDTVNEYNYFSHGSATVSDTSLRSSPLGSSEMSGSSTPRYRKKKASVYSKRNIKKENDKKV